MKLSRFLVALALVAAFAGSAAAQTLPRGTLHLWWSGCDNTATKAGNLTNPVSGTTRMYVSMVGRQEVLQGYKIDVRLRGAGGVLADAWHFEAGGCADGAMVPAATAFSSTTCPIAQGARPLFIYQYTLEPNGEGFMQVGNAFDPFTPDPLKVYTIYRLTLDMSLGCPGNDAPTCAYIYYSETLDGDSIVRLGNVGNRFVTANDPGGLNSCPGTVPTHPATWGQNNNHYR